MLHQAVQNGIQKRQGLGNRAGNVKLPSRTFSNSFYTVLQREAERSYKEKLLPRA